MQYVNREHEHVASTLKKQEIPYTISQIYWPRAVVLYAYIIAVIAENCENVARLKDCIQLSPSGIDEPMHAIQYNNLLS